MRSTILPCLITASLVAGIASPSTLGAQTGPLISPIHPGAWIIGGSGSLDHTDGVTSFSLAPTALDFLNSRVAVGGSGVLSVNALGGGHAYAWGLGPSARLFFADPSSLTLPFFSASVTPEWTTLHRIATSTLPVSTDQNARSIALDASFGITRMLAMRVGLTGEAYFTYIDLSNTSSTITVSSHTSHYGLRVGLTVFVH